MLEGRLGDFTLPDVLKLLAFTSKSGRLTLRHGGVGAFVALVDGKVVAASADERRLTALRRMVASGVVDPRAVTDLLDRSGQAPDDRLRPAAGVTVSSGAVPDGDVRRRLRRRRGGRVRGVPSCLV